MNSFTDAQLTKIFDDYDKKLEILEKEKIDKTQFYWIIGILMTVVCGLFAVIYIKLDSVGSDVSKTQSDVALINGILKGAEITN
jgi:hypothetical protein